MTCSKEHLVLADFVPAPSFSDYASLFKEFEQAANDQLLVEVDRLEDEIIKIGFYVVGPFPQMIAHKIKNLQIMENGISFKFVKTGHDTVARDVDVPA